MGVAPQDNRCKQQNGQSSPARHKTRIARIAREHEALMARNMMSNHADMQDKYCGDCYDTHPIQSQYVKEAAVGRLFFCGFLCIALGVIGRIHANTCLACGCDWSACSSPSRLHPFSPFGQCALARKETSGGRLATGRKVWEEDARGVWRPARLPPPPYPLNNFIRIWRLGARGVFKLMSFLHIYR